MALLAFDFTSQMLLSRQKFLKRRGSGERAGILRLRKRFTSFRARSAQDDKITQLPNYTIIQLSRADGL